MELTRSITGIQKDYYGRGPEFARTYINDDTVVVLMRGGYTKAEETLLAAGNGDAVIKQRMAFQEVIRPSFEAEIERILGRRVIAFMSGSHQDPDLMAEIFVLETLEPELSRSDDEEGRSAG
jgi:uncharacterized protein YbcI